MRDEIVSYLKSSPNTYMTTSEIVTHLFPDENDRIERLKASVHKAKRKLGSRIKSKLHRRALYHLGKLEEENKIRSIRKQKNGEKQFIYSKPHADATMDSMEKLGLPTPVHGETVSPRLLKYEEKKYVAIRDKQPNNPAVDAVLVRLGTTNTEDVLKHVDKLLNLTRDTVILSQAEALLQTSTGEQLQALAADLYNRSLAQDVTICMHFTEAEVEDSGKAKVFIKALLEPEPRTVKTIISTGASPKHPDILRESLHVAAKHRKKLHIHSIDVRKTPTFIGTNGPYTVADQHWKSIRNADKPLATHCISLHTAYVDINKFFSNEANYAGFRTLCAETVKHLVLSISKTRPRTAAVLRDLFTAPNQFFIDFFKYASVYTRFWNYDPETDGQISFQNLQTLLGNIYESARNTARKQSTILQSCGIPIMCQTQFSCAFGGAKPKQFTKRSYNKRTLYNLRELGNDYWVNHLTQREITARTFHFNDRMRIFRSPERNPETTSAEINYLLKNYSLPLICYDFKRLQKEVSLNEFM